MNTPAFSCRILSSPGSRTVIGIFGVAAVIYLAQMASCRAQAPAPTAAPTASPDATPQVTITSGVPDQGPQADYIAARTPLASVVLTTPAGGATSKAALSSSLAAGRAQAASTTPTASTIQPVANGGAFTQVRLTTPPAVLTNKTSQAAANSTGSSQVPLAVVTLNYGASWAGQVVMVRPLSGGTVSATGADGTLYTATVEGFTLELDASGTVTFGFQAPDSANTYQVFTRLDNVSTTFTFTVPDSNS